MRSFKRNLPEKWDAEQPQPPAKQAYKCKELAITNGHCIGLETANNYDHDCDFFHMILWAGDQANFSNNHNLHCDSVMTCQCSLEILTAFFHTQCSFMVCIQFGDGDLFEMNISE